MYVCLCNAVTDQQVRQAVEDGALTTEEVQARLGIGNCCGCCIETTAELVSTQLSNEQFYAA